MTSGCFTWITDFDQLVGVKRINTEWTHLQVRAEAFAVVDCLGKRCDAIFLYVSLEKHMNSVVSCTSEYVNIKCFNLRILSMENKT